jgi:hypothetical protein
LPRSLGLHVNPVSFLPLLLFQGLFALSHVLFLFLAPDAAYLVGFAGALFFGREGCGRRGWI